MLKRPRKLTFVDKQSTHKDKSAHQQGLVFVLRELQADLDRTVFGAGGWSDLADKLVEGRLGATTPLPDKPVDQAKAEEKLLMHLVEFNKQQAEEESLGIFRWLRPEYQALDVMQTDVDIVPKAAAAKVEAATSKGKATFPKTIPDQPRVLRKDLSRKISHPGVLSRDIQAEIQEICQGSTAVSCSCGNCRIRA